MIIAALPWPVIAFIAYGAFILLANLGIMLGERAGTLLHRRIYGLMMLGCAALALWSFMQGALLPVYAALSVFVIFLAAVWRGCEVENEDEM